MFVSGLHISGVIQSHVPVSAHITWYCITQDDVIDDVLCIMICDVLMLFTCSLTPEVGIFTGHVSMCIAPTQPSSYLCFISTLIVVLLYDHHTTLTKAQGLVICHPCTVLHDYIIDRFQMNSIILARAVCIKLWSSCLHHHLDNTFHCL